MSYLRPNEFALVAHRGGPELGPENTLEAFSESLKIYSDFIFELDVRLTRDRQVVVMHDPSVDRTTSGHGLVHELNYSEIQKFDAGHHTQWKGKNIKAPLLKDALEMFKSSRITIEVKLPGYEKDVIEIINRANAQDRVVLSSFEQKAVSELRRFAPNLCSGCSRNEIRQMLWAVKSGLSFIAPSQGNVFQIPTDFDNVVVFSKKFVSFAHKISKQVHVWTINDEPTMRQLILEGADGIISDMPSTLYRVAKELKKI